ncbi:hypothetical protein EVAR_57177_1 [Eumeta japonica]|uniref:Uncharacterized protein n=1 Tax=Eumeta variegata TaxID=151549 RepID=A0A4C1Z2S5_EUMVA|nr:hypothetical protein EVAR_57177_1 [Eumeta japonica]
MQPRQHSNTDLAMIKEDSGKHIITSATSLRSPVCARNTYGPGKEKKKRPAKNAIAQTAIVRRRSPTFARTTLDFLRREKKYPTIVVVVVR